MPAAMVAIATNQLHRVVSAHLSASHELPDADGHSGCQNDDSKAVQPYVPRRAVRQPALALGSRLERLRASYLVITWCNVCMAPHRSVPCLY